MLSKSEITFFASLHQKKYRQQHKSFIAEGRKVVDDLFSSGLTVRRLLYTEAFEKDNGSFIGRWSGRTICSVVTAKDMGRISAMSTPPEILALVAIPENKFDPAVAGNELVL